MKCRLQEAAGFFECVTPRVVKLIDEGILKVGRVAAPPVEHLKTGAVPATVAAKSEDACSV
jgi:hypothetical protein